MGLAMFDPTCTCWVDQRLLGREVIVSWDAAYSGHRTYLTKRLGKLLTMIIAYALVLVYLLHNLLVR